MVLFMVLACFMYIMWNWNSIHKLQLAEAEIHAKVATLEKTQKTHSKNIDGILELVGRVVHTIEKLADRAKSDPPVDAKFQEESHE